MSDTTLRSRLIRLAHTNPNLRADLLPLIASESDTTSGSDGYYMAAQYIQQIADQASELSEKITPGKPLPDWVEAKITQAAAALKDVHGYMTYGG